jgi:hypothetical protein
VTAIKKIKKVKSGTECIESVKNMAKRNYRINNEI